MKTEILPTMTDALRDEMTDSRSDFTAEDKLAVVMAYLISGGNSVKAAKLSAIHEMKANTIRQWKKRAKWWPNAEAHAKALLQKDLDARYTQMMHRTQEEIMDRVENGDEVILKDGSTGRKALGGKDLTYIHGIIHDKRAMIRGEPTSRTEKVNPMQVVNDLAALMAEQGKTQKEDIQHDGGWDQIPDGDLQPTGSRKTH
ncbi:MAG: transposase [Planctomycetota bacterium]|jgi:transposase-like protein